ncbi:MAG: DNA-binding transcription factor yap1 [Chaenotheca gracillima]|nr:MAG: DNA-binding transcription factor yap1 [Chaenotheca gracillima]
MPEDARASLASRVLPKMELSTGGPESRTAPRPALPAGQSPAERAAGRFAISGNALITGGAGFLARTTARALLEHGASGIALLDLPGSHADPTATSAIESLRSEFPSAKVLALNVDITDAEQVESVVGRAAAELPGRSVDMLLCFAGIVGCTHALDMSPTEWRRTLDVNTTGSFLCAQAAAKHMISNGGGSILFTASISAHRVNYPQPQIAYNVSKAALLALKNSLAAEWATYGIRVNSISPGYMDTILNEGTGLEEARQVWKNRNPMGRMGMPEEVAGVCVMLCSKGAGSYVNGADVVVDGGAIVF